ncbi:MAG: TMEM175 family protein [Acidimicrobiales bacterium]|jgi:uncharacterized membrane protein
MSKQRLEGFSDGVIAVAITILALDLAVAGPGHGHLLSQLGHHWPAFVAYVISFATIGIIWVNHHALVSNFVVVTRSLLFLNLILLLFVVALPFATATMAEYLTSGGQDAHIAMALYGLVFEGMSLAFAAIFQWSLGEGRSLHSLPPELRPRARRTFIAGWLMYVVAIGVAFVNAYVSLAIIGLAAVYYIFERTPAAPSNAADGLADGDG